jgi:hypothetical protein
VAVLLASAEIDGRAVVSKAASALALQRDGKFVVASWLIGSRSRVFAVHRYNPNGGLDSRFGRGGKRGQITDFGSERCRRSSERQDRRCRYAWR